MFYFYPDTQGTEMVKNRGRAAGANGEADTKHFFWAETLWLLEEFLRDSYKCTKTLQMDQAANNVTTLLWHCLPQTQNIKMAVQDLQHFYRTPLPTLSTVNYGQER